MREIKTGPYRFLKAHPLAFQMDIKKATRGARRRGDKGFLKVMRRWSLIAAASGN
jgi:hypothetical protein